ncbi:hypothetical protein A2303_02995 [Candidatus Falkowbacteria bacterium RIFOXYB2_FULL_47_14]|uniref:Uncharacterized protein n=1 Tax=Candidatus Falkowbacteria bacterium RIFOXYA2_FULL_47_19 TaxID=1797994 RepID=A0A1F5SFT1_9BACT|nr:MAG: hypothetical protein A2227_07970 [Candidatus Falkowbacteria bacterium RIFOXYA2_FULL_47_19]OGF36352.1 MAG: hypothetical protein A2468_01625 [Candidatus Falkowbacteria bacterium RIFOXYC2_FULL_46_15]OGF43326.1 MAG: hypothetical protein A2303_02995 [Candidatus Falkowbacteria bacterium RIFOXYB2_FULL_47_14]
MSAIIFLLTILAVACLVVCIRRFIPFGVLLKEYEEKYHRDDSCSNPDPAPPEFAARHDHARNRFFSSLKTILTITAILFAALLVRIYFTERSVFYVLLAQIDIAIFIYLVTDCFCIGRKIADLNRRCDRCSREKFEAELRERKTKELGRERNLKFLASIFALAVFTILCGFF